MEKFDFAQVEANRLGMAVAMRVGEPINVKLPVPFELAKICNFEEAEPGERVWTPTNVDDASDVIYSVDTTYGIMTTTKVDPIGETQLTFKHLNSPLTRVNLPDILESNDDRILIRKKQKVTDGLDKTEVRVLLTAILTPGTTRTNGGAPSNEAITVVTPDSSDDLFDVIKEMVETVEDYSKGGHVLLAGSSAYSKVKSFSKDRASTDNYDTDLLGYLKDNNIELIKVSGTVQNTGDQAEAALMDANKLILVALESTNAMGKPITFVRRKLSTSKFPGLETEVNMQRGYLYTNMPSVDAASGASAAGSVANLWSYGICAYESVIFTIDNPKAICVSADLSSIYEA